MDHIDSCHTRPETYLRTSSLAPHLDAFSSHLRSGRYASGTTKGYIACLAHFARWMTLHGLPVRLLGEHVVEQFLNDHLPCCDCPWPVKRVHHELRAALGHLLGVLREQGVIIVPSLPTGHIVDELHRYDEHMNKARGLGAGTRSGALRTVRRLLAHKFAEEPVVIADLRPEDVRQFFAEQLEHRATASHAKALASALRAYFRYRMTCGDQMHGLLGVISSQACRNSWRWPRVNSCVSPGNRRLAMNNVKLTAAQPTFQALVQAFFAEHLTQQRALSPCTVAAYRDAFMLFLNFMAAHRDKSPSAMKLTDITPEVILAFLDYLEHERHNTVRSRNARLAALRSFLKFASHRDVASLNAIERALGVPMKRFERPMLGFLSHEEMVAVIGTPDSSWVSQRDHLLLGLLYNTGARVSEIIRVRVADVVIDGAACVHLTGKGRKQRSVPLWRSMAKEIREWLKLNPQLASTSALLPNRNGDAMTRDNVTKRLALAVASATAINAGLAKRHISPHTIRHATAMTLLQSGVDISVIALWLGHESPTTTHQYVEADLTMKERALARIQRAG